MDENGDEDETSDNSNSSEEEDSNLGIGFGTGVVEKMLRFFDDGRNNNRDYQEDDERPSRNYSKFKMRIRPEMRDSGELIDIFDPEDTNSDIENLLEKVDTLGSIHRWNDNEKSYFMQAKLRGPARIWYKRLNNKYDLSWNEWKIALRKTFPAKRQDFADYVEELLARRKQPYESMTRYYHVKKKLCEICEFRGSKAVSFIIKGLPADIQAKARSFKCRTPDELFSSFIAGLDKYRSALNLKKKQVENSARLQKNRRSFDENSRWSHDDNSSHRKRNPRRRVYQRKYSDNDEYKNHYPREKRPY